MAYGLVSGAGLVSGSYFAHIEAPCSLNGVSYLKNGISDLEGQGVINSMHDEEGEATYRSR